MQRFRLWRLEKRITRIADNPSSRFQISPSNRLKQNDLVIFGTGDRLGVTTLTVDADFVRAFQNRFSTTLDVIVYPRVTF